MGSTVTLGEVLLIQSLTRCFVIYLLGWGPLEGRPQGPQGLELLLSDYWRPVLEILAQNFLLKNVPGSECAGLGGML